MSYKLSIVKNKMMKRIINILILLCCIASLSSCGNSTEERSRVLKIYNWADYIDEDVLAEFPDWYKQQTGEDLRIIYQVFDINEIMLTKIERGHEDFDVVCPSEYIIERMLRKDLLLPIDRNFGHTPDYIPNVSPYIRHELNKTSQPERQTEDYAVPYMWGTAGILFNKKFITAEEADTWDILWDSKNRGKILMKDSYRDAYGTAIIYAHARELADTVAALGRHPCIGCWVPFNEGWGQFDARKATETLRALDPSRPVDEASGWFDRGGGDVHSIHNYFYPLRIRPNVRTVALSEYGGIAWPMPGHEPPRKTYGYGTARSRAELTERYCDLQRKTVLPQLKKGLSALVYTQLTDVEDEVNGLFTYDRTAIKPDAAAVRAVNEALEAEFEKAVKE